MNESRVPLKVGLLLGPLVAATLALHAWGDGAAEHLGRRVDRWQFPEVSLPPFLLRVPRTVSDSWAAKVLGEFPDECIRSTGALLDLHRPSPTVQVILLGPDSGSRRLAGERGEALKENESLYDPERRAIVVRMERNIEQKQVSSALRRGIARLLLAETGSARWYPWLAEGLVGLLDNSRADDLRAAGEDLPALDPLITAREADFRSLDRAAYARAARLLVAYLHETFPVEFAAYCRASREEGQVRLSRFIDRFADPIREQSAWREWIQARK
ncbi:MAG TPA: hypothetical protein VKU80_14825 [Planctomycetota bacterium]|nr:hypothetical protein [Planctomycetota bacterium]